MIASKHINCISEFEFNRQNQTQYFDRKASSVDVVAKEDVFGALEWASGIIVDEFDKVIELTMNIPDYSYWILNFDYVGLLF